MRDEDDRPRDAAGPDRGAAGAAGSDPDTRWADLVVPDDISSLASDVLAYRRELRARHRRAVRRQLLARRGVVPLLVVGCALGLAGIVVSLLTVLGPQLRESRPPAVPLAATTAPPGTVGGHLPAATLVDEGGKPVSSLSPLLRPAVVALIPTGCDCHTLIDSLGEQALAENFPLDVVVPTAPGGDRQAAALPSLVHRGDVSLFYDGSGTLASRIGAAGVTVVPVTANGLIVAVIRNAAADNRTLDADLQRMSTTAGTTG